MMVVSRNDIYTPIPPAHSFTSIRSPTRTTPSPPTTALHPKHALLFRAGSRPVRNFISTLYGTAASRTPVVGSTLGSCGRVSVQAQACTTQTERTRQRVHFDTRENVRGSSDPPVGSTGRITI